MKTPLSDKSKLGDWTQQIDAQLQCLLPQDSQKAYQQLFDAARYSLTAPGKRLRPLLTLAATEALGGDVQKALIPACTLEMVHTYSLIHDDLPSMDDDDLRRGKPTLHRVYPEGQAILAGDFLLTFAFETLTRCEQLSPEKRLSLISTLSKRAGGEGMIAGQVMDLSLTGKNISLQELQEIHSRKTGDMILASLEFAAIICNASVEEGKILRDFACNLGLAFQVMDDILDITSSDSTLGKPVGSDVAKHKNTYVSLLGLEESKAHAKKLHESALALLEQIEGDISSLQSLVEQMLSRKR